MRNIQCAVTFSPLLLMIACATSTPPAPTSAPAAVGTPSATSTITSGSDTLAPDRSVDPCLDFYQFVCGNWIKNHPIPPDQSRWAKFTELTERNREILHQILEKASIADPHRTAVEQKIGDFYASCIDEETVEAKGATPLKAELARIDKIKGKPDLIAEVARLHALGVGSEVLFGFYPYPNLHDASTVVAQVDQGGLGLPEKDYYLRSDPQSIELRKQYLEHVQRTLELLGAKHDAAVGDAKRVMEIETDLAKASMDNVSRRDPKIIDHPMSRDGLAKMAPAFQFNRYFKLADAPRFKDLNVANPDFFRQVDAVLKRTPFNAWKAYLRWHLASSSASALSKPFVDEDFRFQGQILNGQKQLQARWKRCVEFTDGELGEALGQSFVEATFGVGAKQHTLQMIQGIEKAMEQDLRELTWMNEETRQRAMTKLHAIVNKVGFPDKWRDYGSVEIVRGDFYGNTQRADVFERRRQLMKIGRPLDKTEWGMTPPTVNAYYSASENDINFPAGILQPPFYNDKLDLPVNYGAIGTVMGHELTHGFDDQGRKFDAQGNLKDWWTTEDGKEFEKRASCLADEYQSFIAVKPDLHVNGRLTLGENTADNGGLRLSYMALMDLLAATPQPPVDGFTPHQRLFLGFAQIWCENTTGENARLRAQTDTHSPGRYRVNGVVQNMPEFARAFGCRAGQPMVSAHPCRVW